MSALQPQPDWWPDGAAEALVRDCNCEYCGELIDALEEWRNGVAPDGEHVALKAFSGGPDR